MIVQDHQVQVGELSMHIVEQGEAPSCCSCKTVGLWVKCMNVLSNY